MSTTAMENGLALCIKLKKCISWPYDLAILFLAIYTHQKLTHVWTKRHGQSVQSRIIPKVPKLKVEISKMLICIRVNKSIVLE